MPKKAKAKVTKAVREWREKRPRGAIMKPETFKAIKRKAAAAGAKDPEAVAGAAYWKTVKAKYKKAKKKTAKKRK